LEKTIETETQKIRTCLQSTNEKGAHQLLFEGDLPP